MSWATRFDIWRETKLQVFCRYHTRSVTSSNMILVVIADYHAKRGSFQQCNLNVLNFDVTIHYSGCANTRQHSCKVCHVVSSVGGCFQAILPVYEDFSVLMDMWDMLMLNIFCLHMWHVKLNSVSTKARRRCWHSGQSTIHHFNCAHRWTKEVKH